MGIILFAFLIFSTEGIAQASYTYGWEPTGLGSWTNSGSTGNFSRSTTTPCTGSAAVRANVYYNLTNTFTSPSLGTSNAGLVTLGFSYKVTQFSSNTTGATPDLVEIQVQWANATSGPWTTFHTINSTNHVASATCAPVTATFTPGTGSLYVRFLSKAIDVAGPSTSDLYFYYDDISVTQGAGPSCLSPTALSGSVTSATSANLSWTASTSTPSSGYEWEVRSSGTGGSGATGLVASGTTVAGIVSATTSALIADTNYILYVRSNCGAGDFSSWAASSTFFTAHCIPATATGTGTYINNFSTTGGSSNISNLASGFTTAGYQNNYASMEVSSYAGGVINYSLSMVGGTAGIAIWVDWNNNLTFETSERVYNSAGYLAAGNYTGTITVPSGASLGSYRMRVKTDFSNNNPDPCTIGGTRSESEDYKFTVVAAPACVPPTAIQVSAITNNSATLAWTSSTSSPSNGYQYEIRTTGAAGSGATGLTASGNETGNTVNLSTLSGNTTYNVYFRSDCGGGIFSSWTIVTTFTTSCDPVTAFSENFDSVVTPAFPSCWGKIGTLGTAYTQNTTSSTTPNCLYMYSSATASRPVVMMQPVSNAGLGTHRLRFKLRGNFSSGETVEVGYLTNPSDATTFVVLQTVTASTTSYVEKIVEPGTMPGANQVLAFRTGTALLSVLIDDVVWEPIPTDAVDYANLQAFVVNATAVSTMETCQTVDVYAQAYEPGVTEAAGQAIGLTAFVGYSSTNTDPATWPESAWTAATFNVNAGNNDEFKATYTTLPVGTYYFASRFQLNGGPYRYGASNNGFWNATTNPNAVLTVTAPVAINASATTPAFCSGGNTNLTVTSTNANYTYSWSNGAGTGTTVNVAPTSNTTYTVTGTDSVTGCTSTATVTVTVNPTPSVVSVTPSASTICAGSIEQLVATGGNISGSTTIGTATTLTLATAQPTAFCNRYDHYWSQMVFTAAELAAAGVQAGNINAIKFNITTLGSGTNVTDFKVYIGTTTSATLTGFTTTGLTQVFSIATYTHAVGVNTITFDTPYAWDGTSNIIVDMRQTGLDSTNNSQTYYTATTGATVVYAITSTVNTGGSDGFAASNPSATTSVNRLNTTFDWSANADITWSSTGTSDLFTDATATIPYVSGSDATTVYVKPSATATYTATATIGACTSTDSSVITVNTTATPTGDATQYGTTLADLVVSPTTGITWYGSEADALDSTNELPLTTALVDGATYYATQTTTCESVPFAVTIDFDLKTPSFNMNSLKYYPNPVSNVLTVTYSEAITGLKLYNMVGQQLMSKSANSNETQLDMSHLPAGSYLLEITAGNKSKMVKLLKNQ